MVVGRNPRDLRFPRKLDQAREIRDGGQFVLVRCLAKAIQRVAGVALGTLCHVVQLVLEPHEVDGGAEQSQLTANSADLHALVQSVLDVLANVGALQVTNPAAAKVRLQSLETVAVTVRLLLGVRTRR